MRTLNEILRLKIYIILLAIYRAYIDENKVYLNNTTVGRILQPYSDYINWLAEDNAFCRTTTTITEMLDVKHRYHDLAIHFPELTNSKTTEDGSTYWYNDNNERVVALKTIIKHMNSKLRVYSTKDINLILNK